MKVVGIIAEYNPFHNGHQYHIEETRRLTGADYVIVIMSGNFTQRGKPAIIDKYSRAEMALTHGADLVIELPTVFACASAEHFSYGALAILNGLGVVDILSFGSECGDVKRLHDLASFLLNETTDFSDALSEQLKTGYTYPVARCIALESTLPGFSEYADILNHPNNILGMEYCKSIQKLQSKISPFSISRKGSDYLQYELIHNYSSARAIRQSIITNEDVIHIQNQVPLKTYQILNSEYNITFPITTNDLSLLLKYKLLSEEERGYSKYFDVSDDLSERITNHLDHFTDFESFCSVLKSKQLTYTRICRALIHILLEITDEDIKLAKANENLYARMLGFRESASPLLRKIKKSATIPMISKLANAEQLLTPSGYQILKKDIFASHLYESLVIDKFQSKSINEFTRNIIHF